MRMLTTVPYWTTRRSLASDLFDEMDELFENVKKTSTPYYDDRGLEPACEISETDEYYLMSVDLPGLKKEDIKIEMNGDTLSISGERKREWVSDKKEKIQRYEKTYGQFKRVFTLPSTVEAEKIEAHYENGVLELSLPKTSAAQPRKIEIQSGKGGIFNRFLGAKKNTQEVKDVNQ